MYQEVYKCYQLFSEVRLVEKGKIRDMLKDTGIQIGLVGRGRIFESMIIAGRWRYLKHDKAHLKDYGDFIDARQELSAYFLLYNNEHPHQNCVRRTARAGYSGKHCIYSSRGRRRKAYLTFFSHRYLPPHPSPLPAGEWDGVRGNVIYHFLMPRSSAAG